MRHFLILILCFLLFASCSTTETVQEVATLKALTEQSPSISGKKQYLPSPFMTAGDRLYLVGHQDGSFPEIGWHIPKEMAGIWDHPIKLMDGFDAKISVNDQTYELNKATKFTNYPFTNQHIFELEGSNLTIERWQFVPDNKESTLIQYVLSNTSNQNISGNFEFEGHSDLSPTWLGDKTGMIDSPDEINFDEQNDIWVAKDQDNPWFVAFGSDLKSSSNKQTKNNYLGTGASASLTYDISIPANASTVVNFFISGSYQSEEACISGLKELKSGYLQLAKNKKERYEVLAAQSKLTIPDKDLEQTFEWLKYNCDWLVRTVPEIGTGIMAGVPDYPWWFGVDSEYALKGYMAIGQENIVNETIKLLDSISLAANGNGRIVHEVSSNGYVFNKGNINETPQYASLIWDIYKWNGDYAFLEKYFPTVQKGLKWLMDTNDENKNLFPDGFGMMEIHGMDSEMIDVAAYTQRAFADAAKMAEILDKEDLADEYEATAQKLAEKINSDFWSEDFNSYADFIGSDKQAIHLIEDAIVRADTLNKPWAVEELEATKKSIQNNPSSEMRPFVVHHNWVVNTPMEMNIADSDKALKALTTAEKFVNPFGVFVTGIDRDESSASDDGSFAGSKVFSYTGAVMTLPTGVQIISENNYGRPDKALDYLKKMTTSFSYALPGSMYEVSPDYGMIAQAWNIYSYAIPIIQQFFGVQPMAFQKSIDIQLQMPTTWEEASLENVAVADNNISLWYKKENGKTKLKVEQSNTDWTINVKISGSAESYEVLTGNIEADSSEEETVLSSTDLSFEISY